ncbi:MAG: hypothetical protein ACOCRO_00595 [Halanaerobiales bacterium]
MINKPWSEITDKDLIIRGYTKNSKESNIFLKKSLFNYALKKVEDDINIINEEYDLVTTDYLSYQIDNLLIVAERTTVPGPEALINKYEHWNFQGFCTIDDFINLETYVKRLDDEFGHFKRDEFLLDLYVIDGIFNGISIIDAEIIKKWRSRRILVEPIGFDTGGNMVSYTDIIINEFQKFKDEVKKIKKKGGATNIHEERLIAIDTEGREQFGILYGK